MKPILRLDNIGKTFTDGNKPQTVLSDISLSINPGEFFLLLGPSGCGKSTLLRIMSGLEKEHDGKLSYGHGITERDFGFVFQQFALLPWLTVFQNVELGLQGHGVPQIERTARVTKELKRFGLQKAANVYPKELSGGMKQRVGLARAWAMNPKIIFMDEPFSEIDSFTAEELRHELLELWHERKQTIVMVSHQIPEAIELASRIAVMSANPGEIDRIIKNPLPRPRILRAPEFFKLEDKLADAMRH